MDTQTGHTAHTSHTGHTTHTKRTLVVDAHVIAYFGDYMINLKKSLINIISTEAYKKAPTTVGSGSRPSIQ